MVQRTKLPNGDVIAGLVITLINIVAGLVIGVLQKDMAVEAALKRYGLLTIGDGLVTQIPALVLSTAAGILVTRVASEEPDTSLGDELAGQLMGTPKALRNAALFVLALAIVPGLPALPFLVIGGLMLALSRSRSRALRKSQAMESQAADPRRAQRGRKGPAFVPVVVPWSLDVSEDLAELMDDVLRGDHVERSGLRSLANTIREQLFAELGVPLPAPLVRVTEGMPPSTVLVSIFEVPSAVIQVPATEDADGKLEVVRRDSLAALQSRASEFLGIGETQSLLDQLEQVAPALVRQVVPKPISLALLADILRRLVEEKVSIRDLRSILEVLAAAPPGDKDALGLTEAVRAQLRRATSYRLTQGSGALAVYLLDGEIEDTVRGAVQRTQGGSFLALAPAPAREIVAAIRKLVSAAPAPEGSPIVLLTQPDIRRFIRKLLDSDLFLQGLRMEVVSPNDLTPELSLRPLGRASLRAG